MAPPLRTRGLDKQRLAEQCDWRMVNVRAQRSRQLCTDDHSDPDRATALPLSPELPRPAGTQPGTWRATRPKWCRETASAGAAATRPSIKDTTGPPRCEPRSETA